MDEVVLVDYFQTNNFLAFSALLLIGIIGGRLAHMSRFLPRITGYIAAGFILGPSVLGLLSHSLLDRAQIFTGLAISLILFELGTHVNLRWLVTKREIFLMSLAEGAASFALIFLILLICQLSVFNALLIAAIGVSSSPAITLLIAAEYDVNGPMVQKSLFLTALNNIYAFLFFTIIIFLFQFAVPGYELTWSKVLFPFYSLFGSVTISIVLAFGLIYLGRFLGKHENSQFAGLIGTLILANGLSQALSLSPLLTSLAFGIATVNLDKREDLLEVEFGHSGEVFFVILFVFAGAHLHASSLVSIGWLAITFIVARFIGKLIPILMVDSAHYIKKSQSVAVAVTLLPMAGTAIGLLPGITRISYETGQLISTIVLASIAVLETVGPILTLLSLKVMGELSNVTPEDNDAKDDIPHAD